MQQREKILAAVAGLLVLYLGVRQVFEFDPFAARNKELETLEKRAETERDKALRAEHAARKVAQWERQPLSSNVTRSRSDYHYWLLGLIERAKLDDAQVQPERKVTGTRSSADRRSFVVFEKLPFTIHGQGSLSQLTGMLHEFYSADVLHRVRSLTMQPTKSTKTLKLTLVVEALVLPGSVDFEQQVKPILESRCYGCHGPDESNRKAGLRLDEIKTAFEPLESKKTAIVPGKANQSELADRICRGKDAAGRMPPKPDKPLTQEQIDLVTRWIDQGAHFGLPAKMPESHRLALASLDDYHKLIKDRDLFSAYVLPPPPRKIVERPPPKKETRPPPPPPRFDDSVHAYVTAILEIDQRPEIWLYVRTTGKLHKLHEGDEINVGRFAGKIKRIGRRSVEIENDRKVSLIGLGENLRADDGE